MKNSFKLITVILFCLASTMALSQKQETLKLKGVIMENDYHKNITWIKSKPIALVKKDFTVSAYSCTYIQVYFGLYVEDSVQKITPIRIINSYNNSNWIFFNEVSYLIGSRKDVRAGKGKVFNLVDNKTNTEVKNGVTEKSDVIASDNILEMIQFIAKEQTTGIECKYVNNNESKAYTQRVYDGTKRLKKHFSTFIEAYNQITQTYSLNNQIAK